MPPKAIKDYAVEIGDEPHFHEADPSRNAALDRFHREHPRRPSPLSTSTTPEELGGPLEEDTPKEDTPEELGGPPEEETLREETPFRPPSPALQRPRSTIAATSSSPRMGPVSPDTPAIPPMSSFPPILPSGTNPLSGNPAPTQPINFEIRPTSLKNPVPRIDTSSSQSRQTTKWVAHVPPAAFAPSDAAASLTDQRILLNQRELIRRRIAPVLEPAIHPETRISSVNVAGMYRAIRTVRTELTDVKDWQLASAVKDFVGQFVDSELFKGRYFRANRDRIHLRDQNRFLQGEVRRLEMAQRVQGDFLEYKATQSRARGLDQHSASSSDTELQALRDELASRNAAAEEWSETEVDYIKEVSNLEEWINDLKQEKKRWRREEANLRQEVKKLKESDTQQATELAKAREAQGTSSEVSSDLPSSEIIQNSTNIANQLRADNTTLQRHLKDAQDISATMATRIAALETKTPPRSSPSGDNKALIAEFERLKQENERLRTAMDQASRQTTHQQHGQSQSQPASSSALTQSEAKAPPNTESQPQGPTRSDASTQTPPEDEDNSPDTPDNGPNLEACEKRCAELLALLTAEKAAHAHTKSLFRDFRRRVGESQLGRSSQSSSPEEEEEEEEEEQVENHSFSTNIDNNNEISDAPEHQHCRRLLQHEKHTLRVLGKEYKRVNRAHFKLLDEVIEEEEGRERKNARRGKEVDGWQRRLRDMREMIEAFQAGKRG